MASETLASVILPRPDSDLKTELNLLVNDSNTVFAYTFFSNVRVFRRKKSSQQNGDCKVRGLILQGQNRPAGMGREHRIARESLPSHQSRLGNGSNDIGRNIRLA
jgi:hypothetical protein